MVGFVVVLLIVGVVVTVMVMRMGGYDVVQSTHVMRLRRSNETIQRATQLSWSRQCKLRPVSTAQVVGPPTVATKLKRLHQQFVVIVDMDFIQDRLGQLRACGAGHPQCTMNIIMLDLSFF